MGSSAKRKKEKQKDFQASAKAEDVVFVMFSIIFVSCANWVCSLQKTKLRVGKTKPKPDNYTETSFQSKGARWCFFEECNCSAADEAWFLVWF